MIIIKKNHKTVKIIKSSNMHMKAIHKTKEQLPWVHAWPDGDVK